MILSRYCDSSMMSSRSMGVMKSVAALVLDLVRAVHDAAQVFGLGEVLDGLDEQLGLFHRHRGLLFKGVKVVELVLLGH